MFPCGLRPVLFVLWAQDRETDTLHMQFQLDDTQAYTLRGPTGEIVLGKWTFLFGFSTTRVFGENEITLPCKELGSLA